VAGALQAAAGRGETTEANRGAASPAGTAASAGARAAALT